MFFYTYTFIQFISKAHVSIHREAMKQLQHEDHVNEQITDILSHEGLDPKHHDEGSDNVHRVINRSVLYVVAGYKYFRVDPNIF